MIRDRLLGRRWLVWLVLAWGLALAAVPGPADAAPLPPARGAATPGSLPLTELERRLVQSRLAAVGVSESDAAAVWARLTPEERAELAARATELRAGGNVVAAVVAIGIIVAMVVILTLELIGRRVISRPTEPEGVQP